MDGDLERAGISFFIEHQDSIRKLCYKLCRRVHRSKREQIMEDALDEAQRVIPLAIRSYHENGASLKTHVLGAIRWKVWGRVVRRDSYGFEALPEQAIEATNIELLSCDEVQYIVGELPDAYALILQLRYIKELNFDEIGRLFQCSASSAHRFVEDALEAARGIAKCRD